MRRHLFHFLGGLLAVAALAVIPSAASAAPLAAVSADASCSDDNEPYSGWGHSWWHDGDRPYWHGWNDGDGYFGGRSYDPGCDAAHPGAVDRVMVAVQRMRGATCNNMSPGGRLGPRRGCSHIAWFKASGTRHWHHRIPRSLPSGHYRLHRRAVDASGNREAPKHRHLWIR